MTWLDENRAGTLIAKMPAPIFYRHRKDSSLC
jgi:hypothetical protein